MSACTQSVLCAEVGQLELARHYLHEAALMDLHDLHHNTRSGIHLGCMAGAWTAVVEGLGGMRRRGEQLHLAPALPGGLTKLIFRLRWRGIRFLVEISDGKVRVSLSDHDRGRLPLVIYGERVEVTGARAVERPLRHRTATLATPPQPPGRGPITVTSRRDTRPIADPAG